LASAIRSLLEHPLTSGVDLDDPRTTELRKRITLEKPFLRKIYEEWYAGVIEALPAGPGPVLELGSGGGFLDRFVPQLIKSDIMPVADLSVVLDGRQLPFRPGSLRAIVMTNVFHHIPDARSFLSEAARSVRPSGKLILIEPWVSRWASFVLRRLHHEPFEPDATSWEFPSTGPLSSANTALAWIVFARDRCRFEQEFPEWEVASIRCGMPFRYLLSGGVSLRGLMPGWTFGAWKTLEKVLVRSWGSLVMFAQIVLLRRDVDLHWERPRLV